MKARKRENEGEKEGERRREWEGAFAYRQISMTYAFAKKFH